MTAMEPVTLSFGAALILGLSFGAGPCNIACLPYLGPVFMATEGGVRNSWRTLVPFSAGRLSGYALLGAIAGWAGLLVQGWISHPSIRLVLGGATIAVAIALLLRNYRAKVSCNKTAGQQDRAEIALTDIQRPLLPSGLFFMGMGMALNPCAPLTTVIFAAAATASAVAGLSLGMGFGMGAVIVPSLIFAFGVAHVGAQIREHLQEWRTPLERFSVALLLLMGTATALGWIAP